MSDGKHIPEGRLGRLARIAATGARAGASMLLDRSGEGTAQRAAEVLGTLRGVAAKVGQMASYVDGVVPDGHRDVYETAMKSLQSAAATSNPTLIRRRVEDELKAPIDRLFASFTDEPMASASIGQVHRATMTDGTDVVVKVQHPGIDTALESDLANTRLLEGMLNAMGGRRIHVSGMFDELRARFREELDYALEGQRQTEFQAIHRGDATIRIPDVIHSHTAKRVLTSRFVNGKSFDEACGGTEDERRRWAETMWRFVFKGNLVGGRFNADPHPGNYLFGDDGVVTFLDFGCVQVLEEPVLENARAVHHHALHGDEEAFRAAASRFSGTKPGRYDDMATAFIRRCFNPIFNSPYRITRAYAGELFTTLRTMAAHSRTLPDHEVTEMPRGVLFLNRLNFGFYSVLARLDVEVDYRAVERRFMEEARS